MEAVNVEIFRPASVINKNLSYKIVTNDNCHIGDIKAGEKAIIRVDKHVKKIKAKLMWCSSKEIDVKVLNNQTRLILTQNYFLNAIFPFLGGLFPLTFVFTGYIDILKHNSGFIIGLIILFFVCALTLWKDRWLILKTEVNHTDDE